MIARIAVVMFGSLLIAIGIAWAVGPVRLLAGLLAVPLLWAIVTAAVFAAWIAMRAYGGYF